MKKGEKQEPSYVADPPKEQSPTSENAFEVERIIKKRHQNGEVKYLVKWYGYDEKDNTWEPIQNLAGCLGLVADFEKEQHLKRKRSSATDKNHGAGKYCVINFSISILFILILLQDRLRLTGVK